MQSAQHINKGFTPILSGFLAGFFATLIFHQTTLWVLRTIGIAPFAPFNMTPTQPFAIPAVISLAIWGGAWGVLFAWIRNFFSGNVRYWLSAFLFGAIFPSLVALLIVAPLKGHPVGGGWPIMLLLTAFLINGAWGLGTAFFLNLMGKFSGHQRSHMEDCPPGAVCH